MGAEGPKPRTLPRILFFVHDGGGLGHLRRLSRVAAKLERNAACMIICGHRDAAWIVSKGCEYAHIPSLDTLLSNRAKHWGRRAFGRMAQAEALKLRSDIMAAVLTAFDPDVIVVDHLPFGKYDELRSTIEHARMEKVFITRGILDSPERVRASLLRLETIAALEHRYSRFLVACDPRISNIALEYGLPQAMAEKINYVGYVAPDITKREILAARKARGLAAGDKWVVCSAGSGLNAESLLLECIRLASQHTEAFFDIILGPRTRMQAPPRQSGRVRVRLSEKRLDIFNAAADVVVTTGGYNSLVEALQGDAAILAVPVQPENAFEQYVHTTRLGKLEDVRALARPEDLARALVRALSQNRRRSTPRVKCDGAQRIAAILGAIGTRAMHSRA